MYSFPRSLLLLITLSFVAAPPSFACYSGLTIIPTADTIGNQQYGLEFQMDGSLPDRKADTYFFNTEVGINEQVEVGIDYDLSSDAEPRFVFNGKYQFFKNGDGSQTAAVGICNVADKLKTMPYLVGTKEFSAFRGHLGAMLIDGKTCLFVGADREMNDRLTLMADYTNGKDNYYSLGANYQFTNSLSLMAGAMFPNTSGDTLFTLHLCYGGSYTK